MSSVLDLVFCCVSLKKQHPHYFCKFKKPFSNSTYQKLRTPGVYPSQVFPCLPACVWISQESLFVGIQVRVKVLTNKVRYRGFYMAARRYEISLWVLKNISRVSAANEWSIFSTWEENFPISKRPCNVLFIIYLNTNEIPNHFNT